MKRNRSILVLSCCAVALALLVCLIVARRHIKLNSHAVNSPSGHTAEEAHNTLPANPALSAEATVTIEGRDTSLKVNSIGSFPRVVVPAEATIPIQIRIVPNASVQLVALDGGIIGEKANAEALVADSAGRLNFQYQIRKEPGNYRVAVNCQGQRLTFNFWVGPELTPRVSR